jgi:DNA modification methylase
MKIRDRIRELRRVPASELRPNPKNWRTHPEAQANALKGLLAEVGIADAVLARELPDGSLMLLDGHLRAETLGEEVVPVLVLDVDEAEGDKVLATLDPLAAMAEADAAKLDAILREVDTGSPDVQQLLADLADEAGLYQDDAKEIVEDEVPEPPADPITKPGDLWLLGDHRLLCGDSTKAEDVERLMAGAKADLCFTSPPYSDQREYCGNDLSIEKVSDFLPAARNHASVFCVNLGMARKGGAVDTYWDVYIAKAAQSGLKLVSWNIWDRGRAHSVGQMTACFPIEHEFVFVFADMPPTLIPTIENDTAGQRYTCRNRGSDGKLGAIKEGVKRDKRELGTIYFGLPVTANTEHPAQFPVDFPAAYIRSFAGNVYEPFCGSGTTLIAAEQLGRKCYGMEISPQYCDVIVNRWETLTGKKATLANE